MIAELILWISSASHCRIPDGKFKLVYRLALREADAGKPIAFRAVNQSLAMSSTFGQRSIKTDPPHFATFWQPLLCPFSPPSLMQ